MKQKLFNVYLFLLIFNIVNREFVPLIDLRYVVLIFSFILLVSGVKEYISNKKKNDNKQILFIMILLYITIFLSNFNLINFNQKYIEIAFYDLLILYLYNIINIINVHVNSKYIKTDKVLRYFKFSLIFLAISMIGSMIFGELPFSNYSGIARGLEHYNIFGLNFRLSGYAIDPNYVTLLSFIFMPMIYFFDRKNKKNIFYYILAILLICFSFSKTIMLTMFPVALICLILNKVKEPKKYNLICLIILLMVALFPFILYGFNFMGNTDTMSTRYKLWGIAINMFLKKPFLGNGLSSFRIIMGMDRNWFVQCHSTFLQLLSENGLISLILFVIISFKILKKNNKYINFTFLVYLFFSITYESVYLSFIILFFAINLFLKGEENEKK